MLGRRASLALVVAAVTAQQASSGDGGTCDVHVDGGARGACADEPDTGGGSAGCASGGPRACGDLNSLLQSRPRRTVRGGGDPVDSAGQEQAEDQVGLEARAWQGGSKQQNDSKPLWWGGIVNPQGPYSDVTCANIAIPGVSRGALACKPHSLSVSEDATWPLHVFGHGDGSLPTKYQHLLEDIASFGFVVVAYNSCKKSVSGILVTSCLGGASAFLEILKVINAFDMDVDLATKNSVDVSKPPTISGHSTGGRAVQMAGAVKDNPNYLKGAMWGYFDRALNNDNQALRKAAQRIAAVVAMHPDLMTNPSFNPDVPGFYGAINATPVFFTDTVQDHVLDPGGVWVDFLMTKPPHKIYANMDEPIPGGGHMEPAYHGFEGPFVAYFCQAFAEQNSTAYTMVYGDCDACLRNALNYSAEGQRNSGNGTVGLLLCGQSLTGNPTAWQPQDSPFCNASTTDTATPKQ